VGHVVDQIAGELRPLEGHVGLYLLLLGQGQGGSNRGRGGGEIDRGQDGLGRDLLVDQRSHHGQSLRIGR